MLGYAIALEFLRGGHSVEAVAQRPASLGPTFDDHVKLHLRNLEELTQQQLVPLMQGMDVVVHAFGPDDRVAPPAPASAFFSEKLGGMTERVVLAARQAGVKKVIVLGSYFVSMHRLHPQWHLAQRHPYIAARVEQEQRAFAAGTVANGTPTTDVMVLELPYIFGVTPGRTPFWKDVLFERVRVMPVAMYPRGGSTVMTTRQVGEAVVGAALRGEHGRGYPTGDVNMSWNELIGIIRGEMGLSTRIINIPPLVTSLSMQQEAARQRREGKESGLDLRYLARDIMHREFYFDSEESRAVLGHQPGGVEQAIRETVRASYP